MPLNETRLSLSMSGTPTPSGTFEILAITAGEGNGWKFSSDCLKASVALWDGAETFIDHAWFGHSLRDLAGVCHTPTWDETAQGIKLTLKPVGPSAPLLVAIGKELIADSPSPSGEGQGRGPRVGFSADITFTSKGKEVQNILKVYSLDLVYNPARGGAFVRALNSIQGHLSPSPLGEGRGEVPPSHKEIIPMPEDSTPLQAQMQEDKTAVSTLLQEQQRIKAEADAARAIRVEMCGHLLEQALSAANLPPSVGSRIRKQFSGQVYDPASLNAEIDDARKMITELTGSLVVQGPGRVQSMFSSEDQLQAAVDDLFEAPRNAAFANAKVHKLQGIRELYMMLTGDIDLHGGYDRSRVNLATTSDFSGLVKNAMNKIVVDHWQRIGEAGYDWWKKIAIVEHFNSLQSITGTLVGTVGTLPSIAEGEEYTELAIGDSPETASWGKYGGYIPLTMELIDRDDTRKLKAYPRELAAAGIRKISALVAAIFSSASGYGPTMADTGTLFNATAVTTKGGHANLLTAALASDKWELVQAAVYAQPMLVKQDTGYYGTGSKMGINPRYLLVPRALELTAKQILYPSLERAATINSENQQRGQVGDVVVVPDWTDATDFAAACDPAIAPAIYVGERFGLMPEIFIAADQQSPAVFMNDEHRIKVRHFLAVWVNDFRPLHKSIVSN